MRYPLLVLSALLLSCGGDDGGVTAPATGSLEIRASTTGESGADYMVAVDGASGRALAPNGTLTISDLELGFHTVEIVAPPPGCTVVGDNPRTVSVIAGSTNVVTFVVNCVPLLGSIQVTTVTTGSGPPTYDLVMDGTSVGPIGSSATRIIENVPPGSHTINLGSIPTTCQVQGELPQAVTVEASSSATVSFAITCSPAETGTLTIVTTTTGSDPDGYQVTVDGGVAQPIGTNATLAILNTLAGAHSVLLSGLAPDCSVAGANPVNATVTAGGNTTVSFVVNCTQPNAPPIAEFTHECDGMDCSFTSTSTDNDGTIETWAWDFGDRRTSDEENPSHTYSAPGTYEVELTVRDDDGATDDVTHQVTVSAAEPAASTTSITEDDPDPSNPGEAVTVIFTVSSPSGTPGGSVTVTTTEGDESCTDELEDGAGSCSLELETSGEHTLTATYEGSDAFESSSDTEEHSVRASSATVIESDEPDPSEAGVPFTVEFTVTVEGGSPTGSVTVSSADEDATCTDEELDEEGSGSCELTLIEEVEHTLTAEYSGDDNFAPSTSAPVEHQVNPPESSP
jgi:PKD repeat protein